MNLKTGGSITMSYQPYCDFASGINPLIITFAWLSAGLLVIGGGKD